MYFSMNYSCIILRIRNHGYLVEGDKMPTINIIHIFWGGGYVTRKGQVGFVSLTSSKELGMQ
jgi:hypothetical protein